MQARAAMAHCERMLRRGRTRPWRAGDCRYLARWRCAPDWWEFWRSPAIVGGVVLVGALEAIAAPPNRARCRGDHELSGSRMIDEWCCSFLSQDVWSSYDIGGATIQASTPGTPHTKRTVLLQGDSGDLQDDLSRRLCWYVSFSDLFPRSRRMSAADVVDEAATLMQDAIAWRLKSEANHDPECPDDGRNNSFPFFRPFFQSSTRARCNGSATTCAISEKPRVDFTWIDAPKSKGLALVCIAPEEKLAVVAVRGSVNIRNILMALKVWPQTLMKDDGVGVCLHSGFAEVADEMLVKIEPLLEKGMSIHLTGHSLGGAVSTILALRLKAKGYDISQVVAFGMPLVFWGGDAETPRLDIPLLRVEHPLDPIVHFPGKSRPEIDQHELNSEVGVGRRRLDGVGGSRGQEVKDESVGSGRPLVSHEPVRRELKGGCPEMRRLLAAPVHALGLKLDDTKRSYSRYFAVGRRVSIGNGETLPAINSSPFDLNRGVAAHRLRSYSVQCSMMVAA